MGGRVSMVERMGKPTDFETGIPDGILSPSPQKKIPKQHHKCWPHQPRPFEKDRRHSVGQKIQTRGIRHE
jgi:hypothetical protein